MSTDHPTKMVRLAPEGQKRKWDWRAVVVRISFIAVLIILWQLVAMMKIVPSYLFPGPDKVGAVFLEKIQYDLYLLRKTFNADVPFQPPQPSLTISIFKSMGRMGVGYGISVLGGLTLGVLLARSWLLKQTLGTLIMSLQSIPSICWLPFALIWFGIDDKAILAVVILGAMFSMAISTEGAIRNISPIYIKVGKTLGARNLTLAKDILFFAALPELVGGLKVGWTFAWRSLMAAELVRSDSLGVGQLLDSGRQYNDMPLMFVAVFTILAIGVTVDLLLFGTIERAIRRRWGLEK
ncbi:ABC transporter permease [Candidatus Sumerlaeota bacterium]|nr:ABC transporter permease [Candidatus Sumerlaeota bacterium]